MAGSIMTALSPSERTRKTKIIYELSKDLPLYFIAGIYALSSCIVIGRFSSSIEFKLFSYTPFWFAGSLFCILTYILIIELPRTIKARSKRPLTDALKATHQKISFSRLIVGGILICVTSIVWSVFSCIKNMLPSLAPFWLDQEIADLGQMLHGGYTPWKLLHPLLGYYWVTRTIEVIYLNGWMLMLIVLSVFLALNSKYDRLRIQYFATMFLVLFLLGNIIAGLGMSAGPIYYGYITGDHQRYSGLVDYLAFSKGLVSSASDIQDYLWSAFINKNPQLGSGISAFPSIHVAMATLFLLAGWNVSRRFGRALISFWLLIFVGSIHLGWHYSLDGYASAVGTFLLWQLVGWLQRHLSPSVAAQIASAPLHMTTSSS